MDDLLRKGFNFDLDSVGVQGGKTVDEEQI